MSAVVVVVGALIVVAGLLFLIAPGRLKHVLVAFAENRAWLYSISLVRVVLGVLFLLAAPDTRYPTFIRVVGVLTILAGVVVPALGRERITVFARWWIDRRDSFLRLWAVLALALGGLLIWAAI